MPPRLVELKTNNLEELRICSVLAQVRDKLSDVAGSPGNQNFLIPARLRAHELTVAFFVTLHNKYHADVIAGSGTSQPLLLFRTGASSLARPGPCGDPAQCYRVTERLGDL